MSGRKPSKQRMTSESDATSGLAALSSYARILDFMTEGGKSQSSRSESQLDLPFIGNASGLRNLLLSMSAVAPATPDTSDEEWNPLSQRPHALLPASYIDELGSEITALKTAVDEFTILSHELMHVALWEPFFAGYWRPHGRKSFQTFSLMSEGFCYFFSDIVVSGAIRVRLPDGEFALDRQTASNARFHPVRAFKAAGISSHQDILDIYLDGFSGKPTRLWQPRGANDFGAALAAQAYDFYKGTLGYLSDMHTALGAFGGISEFYQRYCAIAGLPSFLEQSDAPPVEPEKFKSYFTNFFQNALNQLDRLTQTQVTSIRWRRMLQMRAYYALQLRWLMSEGHVTAQKPMAKTKHAQIADELIRYLEGLEDLLHQLALQPDSSPTKRLATLDARYSSRVRAEFLRLEAWVGRRWLIAPNRAGGSINIKQPNSSTEVKARKHVTQTAAFLVEELSAQLAHCRSAQTTTNLLAQIKSISEIGAKAGSAHAGQLRQAERSLKRELGKQHLLNLWSLPLASFDPVRNQYRELVFSYQ